MSKKFEVEDRVSVYGFTYDGTYCHASKATLKEFGQINQDKNLCTVQFDGDIGLDSVHIGQCRKLVKKPRRRVWIDKQKVEAKLYNVCVYWNPATKDADPDLIEFVEVRKPK